MDMRYQRNIPAITSAEQELLKEKKILILGCGGLGGFLLEYLARLGVGEITAVDGDTFEPSNLNRQLLSSPSLLGKSKALAAARRLNDISPETHIHPVETFFCEENAGRLIAGKDLVMDALDSLPPRLLLEETCARLGVPFVHGAIQGWNLQAAVGLPGEGILSKIYGNAEWKPSDDPRQKTSLPMTPAVCAGIQAAEGLKLLLGRKSPLTGRLFLLNLLTMEQRILAL